MPKPQYKPKKCLNPDCPSKEFIPSRSDKVYCDEYCRGKHFRLKNNNVIKREYRSIQELKRIDKTLKRIYENCEKNKIETVPEALFSAEDIQLERAINVTADEKSRLRTYWFYNYGIKGISINKFKIVKKPNND